MKYFRLLEDNKKIRLAVQIDEDTIADLTSALPNLTDISQLILTSNITSESIIQTTEKILNKNPYDTYNVLDLMDLCQDKKSNLKMLTPVSSPEIWAAGVTYKTSAMERRRESDTPDVYSKVYTAKRPEIFLKSTANRCSNPFENIGIRNDSKWNVPEPELAIILYDKKILGYTIGNDVSSRSIEGENPLYLPQAKIYDKSCSIGPCIVLAESLPNPENLSIECTILRKENLVFQETTSTSLLTKSFEDLSNWLQLHNTVPNMTSLLTGTAIVPPPEFTLLQNDVVKITVDQIGTLENTVLEV
ncbi:MAG: fumarylacetoacetate hydrolase [SAR202 cluster bacterium]|nr:fumarylacetoacetate hydrolase [SAR202 cluster bacterium]|tara:strand:- start:4151 stop:5059 length:909 start_codon:yes stop_codon:yes gene_type:complete